MKMFKRTCFDKLLGDLFSPINFHNMAQISILAVKHATKVINKDILII